MLTRNQTLGLFSGPIVRPEPALVFKTIHILAGFLQQHYFLLPGNPRSKNKFTYSKYRYPEQNRQCHRSASAKLFPPVCGK